MANLFSSEIVAVIKAVEWDVEPTESVIRLALYGGMYSDTENPSGAKQHYSGRIKSDVVLEKKIGVVFWNEDSSIDFGYIDVAVEDQPEVIINFAQNVTIATVDIYRVNLDTPDQEQLSLASSSRCSDIGFTDEYTIRFRLESALQGGFDAPINELYYDSTYPQLDGKPYPVAWGLTTDPQQILETVFVDATSLLYHVTDLEIASFESDVYDRGIALTESSEFVAADNGFELQQNPDGKITCGQLELIDPEETSGTFTGLFRFIRLAMSRAGLWQDAVESELTTLMEDTDKGVAFPQFFSLDVVKLETFMEELFDGIGGWYYVDEFAQVHFGRITDPNDGTSIYSFDDSNTYGEIKLDDDKAPGLSTRISHGENPGAYNQDELAGGVANATRLAMTNLDYVNSTTEPVISFYEKAATREPIKLAMAYGTSIVVGGEWTADETTWTVDGTTHTADGTGGTAASKTSSELAQTEIDRWWAELYPLRRRFYSFATDLNNPLFDSAGPPQLGDVCELQSNLFDLLETPKKLLIRGLRFDYSNNLVTIEGWG